MLNTTPSHHFLLSSYPARWIDQLILYSPETRSASPMTAKQVAASALARVISITVLPIFLLIDTLASAVCVMYRFSAYLMGCETWEKTARIFEVFRKCLRGLAASPFGLIWPDIVSNHYLPERTHHPIEPTGGLYFSSVQPRFPQSKGALIQLVTQAAKANKKISIAGAGFSQGRQTLPSTEKALHLNMSRINHVYINKETKTARVGAGATWGQIQTKAEKSGLAIKIMQASNVFSVGGSLSANCHGWDHLAGALANTVNWIRIVNAEGKLQKLTPEDELFHFVVGGYGMFGVIYEVKLQLADNEMLTDTALQVPIEEYTAYFRENIEPNLNIKMHLFRLSLERGRLLERGWAQSYSYSGPPPENPATFDAPERGYLTERILMHVARDSYTARKIWWWREENSLARTDKPPLSRTEIMRPPINAAFATNGIAKREWLQEYFVPEEQLAGFIHFLAKVLNQNDVALLNASIRYVKQDNLAKMGYAAHGDRFAVVLFFSQSLNPAEIQNTCLWVREVVDHLASIGGTFYLPYMHFAARKQFQACYPQYEEILAAKRRYDPNELFENGLYQDYLKEEVV